VSPRRYNSDRRKAAAADTRRKIVDSTVELHAEHGVLATSYAMIAKRADVAVPTVYNHFPTRRDLLAACTGQAAAGAPPFGPGIFQGADGVAARLEALVHALSAYYRYYAPWMRWATGEARFVPELATWLEQTGELRRRLVLLALEPAFAREPPAPLLALCDILLDFPAWQRLTGDRAIGSGGAEAVLFDALMASVEMHGAPATQVARRGKPRTKWNVT